MKQVNFKQIIFHFIASLMILLAVKNIVLFFYVDLLSTVDKHGFQEVYDNTNKYKFTIEEFLGFSIFQNVIVWVGILISFLFSIFVTFKKKWSFWNSILIFLILIVLNLFKLLNFSTYYISIGSFFSNFSIRTLLNIVFFFAFGFYLFFSKSITSIISSDQS